MEKCFTVVFLIIHLSLSHCRHVIDCPNNVYTQKWGPYLQQVSHPFEHGEEPFWDDRVQLLYFVDLHKGLIISFNPITDEFNSVHLDGDVTPVIPTNTLNKFAVGNNNSLVTIIWDGKNDSIAQNLTILSTVDENKPGNRFNDGKADTFGRLWWGTMGYENSSGVIPNQASLYKFTKNEYRQPIVEIRPVSISNGLAWSKNDSKFYYIDTPTRKIEAYDFDAEKGEISNKQIVFDLNNYEIGGSSDGMTIDEDDNLFIALFNGGAVIKIDPKTGKLLQKIAIPAKQVTSCIFGGQNLDILFITTSRFGLSDDELASQPAAGSLFAITGLGRGRQLNFADV